MSFRPGPERRQRIEAWAREHGYEVNSYALIDIVDRGLGDWTPRSPHDILAEAEAKAAHLGLTRAHPVNRRSRWAFER